MRKQLLLMGFFIFLIGPNLTAEERNCRPAGEEERKTSLEVVRVKGQTANGILTLEISPGPAATRAIRIYSEPSHTLLAIMEDSKFAADEEGRQWRSQAIAEQQARSGVLTDLPAGHARLFLDSRPVTDDRIAVWVYGEWPGAPAEDRLAGDAVVGVGDFEFSIAVPLLTPGNPFGPNKEWTHCCYSPYCWGGQTCRTCNTPYFTCCTLGICCAIDCYWVPSCTCADGCC